MRRERGGARLLWGAQEPEANVLAGLIGDPDFAASRGQTGRKATAFLLVPEGDVRRRLRVCKENALGREAAVLPGAPDRGVGPDRERGAPLDEASVVVGIGVTSELARRPVRPVDVGITLDVAAVHPGGRPQLPVAGC